MAQQANRVHLTALSAIFRHLPALPDSHFSGIFRHLSASFITEEEYKLQSM